MALTEQQTRIVKKVFNAAENGADIAEAEALVRSYLAGEIDVGVLEYAGGSLKALSNDRDKTALRLIAAKDDAARKLLRDRLGLIVDSIRTVEEAIRKPVVYTTLKAA